MVQGNTMHTASSARMPLPQGGKQQIADISVFSNETRVFMFEGYVGNLQVELYATMPSVFDLK